MDDFLMSNQLFLITLVAVASIGCRTSVEQFGVGFSSIADRDIIYFDSICNAVDRDSLLSAIDRAAPKGTPISKAESLMTDAGFECTHCSSASFYESEDGVAIGGYRFVANADYLLCTLPLDRAASHEHNWAIAILYDKRRNVSDILAKDDSSKSQPR